MSAFSHNSSHVGSLPPPAQQQNWPRQPSDQRSKASNTSTNTVQHNTDRKVSASSAGSLSSYTAGPLRIRNENVSPSRTASYATLPKAADPPIRNSPSEYLARHVSTTLSGRNELPSRSQLERFASLSVNDGTLEDIDLNATDDSSSNKVSQQGMNGPVRKERRGLSFDVQGSRRQATDEPLLQDSQKNESGGSSVVVTDTGANHVQRFISNLRPQTSKHKRTLSARAERWSLDDFDDITLAEMDVTKPSNLKGHCKASSWSSDGFVTTVKSATVGQGPATAAEGSQKGSRFRFLRRSKRSSRMSDAANRSSMDSNQDASRIADEAARNRALQRRKILDELLASEEGYINDLKILAHVCAFFRQSIRANAIVQVYLTILASTPQFPRFMQVEVDRNLSEILILHEEILIQIKIFLQDPSSRNGKVSARHRRWNSVDSVEGNSCQKEPRSARRSFESLWFRQFKPRSLAAEPQEAAGVAKVFGRMVFRPVRS
ncbi:MAG: hypothetical protein Q9217_000033 [Psora testacea]